MDLETLLQNSYVEEVVERRRKALNTAPHQAIDKHQYAHGGRWAIVPNKTRHNLQEVCNHCGKVLKSWVLEK